MKYFALFTIASLGLAGCSASDQTASEVFDAANQTNFVQSATSVPCTKQNLIKAVSFEHKCWERDVTEAEIESIRQEAVELGLVLQQAMNLPSELVENDIGEFVVLRGETKADCAHYIQAYVTPVGDETKSHTMEINLGVTTKPHCGPIEISAAS
jgi:PBP1b-binding outer membrane lipoprotein LpoB